MRTGVAITLTICSVMYYAVTLVSGFEKRSYIDDELTLPLSGEDLRALANSFDLYNNILTRVVNQYPEQFKRGGGCRGFSACAQLAEGQSALRNILHNNRAPIFSGASGPGKRKRSTDDQAVLPISGDDLRTVADEVDLFNTIISETAVRYPEQFKRGEGCKGFSGCAQLAAGQSALQAMIHNNRASLFGSSGPGKRKRSAEQV